MARTVIPLTHIEDTYNLARQLSSQLNPGQVYAFYGEVGLGKTTMIKEIVNCLNFPKNEVTSPTFTYLNIYPADLTVYHFDLYRFTEAKEFLEKGFDEYFETNGVCFIEWAEKIDSLLPENTKKIRLFYEQGKRVCQLT